MGLSPKAELFAIAAMIGTVLLLGLGHRVIRCDPFARRPAWERARAEATRETERNDLGAQP